MDKLDLILVGTASIEVFYLIIQIGLYLYTATVSLVAPIDIFEIGVISGCFALGMAAITFSTMNQAFKQARNS